MRYLLTVLTHGPDFSYLERTLEAFAEHVTPPPTDAVLVVDGPYSPPVEALPGARRLVLGPEQVGFCVATRACWTEGAASDADYVFHLEHDFLITRPVDLHDLAVVLDANPTLAQMALIRDAVNEAEKAAGGLFESRPGQWELRETGGVEWLEEREFFTTNPSLMRRDFMAQNPWPDGGEPYCEGRFGVGLRERGYSFGFLGRGEVWVNHVGTRSRTGHGY